MAKVAVVLHAQPGTHDAMGRALHALLYTQELHERGHDVQLIFDGGGTRWVDEFNKADHPLAPLFRALKQTGVIGAVCEYCVTAFGGDKEAVQQQGLPLAGAYKGHPSVAELIEAGYQVITL